MGLVCRSPRLAAKSAYQPFDPEGVKLLVAMLPLVADITEDGAAVDDDDVIIADDDEEEFEIDDDEDGDDDLAIDDDEDER